MQIRVFLRDKIVSGDHLVLSQATNIFDHMLQIRHSEQDCKVTWFKIKPLMEEIGLNFYFYNLHNISMKH